MTSDLDARMHAAAGALRRSADSVPADVLPTGRRPGGAPVAVVAMVLVLGLVAGVVLLARDTEPDVTTESPADASDIPRLILGDLPAGMEPTGAIDLPMDVGELFVSNTLTVYGDPAADDPFAQVDLGVTVFDAAEEMELSGDPVIVRGRPGFTREDLRFGVSVAWSEQPDLVIMVASHMLGRDRLLALVEALMIDGPTVSLDSVPADVRGRLAPLASGTSPLGSGGMPAVSSAAGYVVAYQADDFESGLAVSTIAGDASELALQRWTAGAVTPVEVRDRRGWAGNVGGEPDEGPALIWEEEPGILALVEGWAMTEAELLDVAESLRPATDEEWDALLALLPSDDDEAVSGSGSDVGSAASDDVTEEPATTIPGAERAVDDSDPTEPANVYLQGEYANGTWSVYEDDTGAVCGSVVSGNGEGSGCTDDPVAASLQVESASGDPVVLYGVMPEGAVACSLPGGPTPQVARMARQENSPLVYAFVIYGLPEPTEVTFYDAGGGVVDTARVT